MKTNYRGARRLAGCGCRGVLVTGASAGIGLALARQLSDAGIAVVAAGRNRDSLATLAREHTRVIPVVCDLSNLGALAQLSDEALRACPALDCVIHNAAIQCAQRLDDGDYDDGAIHTELATNLLAPLVLTRRLLTTMRRRERAWVVTVGSVLALAPRRNAAVYSASKAGLDSFSRAMRLQARGSGVRFVHAVLPLVDTAMTAGRGRGKISPEVAADGLLGAVADGKREAYLGKARVVPWLRRFAPGVLAAKMRSDPLC